MIFLKKCKKKITSKDIAVWSLTFTKKVVVFVTFVWFIQVVFSAIMMWYAVQTTGNFSYLDTFISDNGETFRLIVGVNIVSKTLENVFKYNNGGIFGTSITNAKEGIENIDETLG